MSDISSTVKLHLDSDALISNWRALDEMSGSANAGAAVKANAYGLGAIETTRRLQSAGCRDFFVANWQEASEIEPLIDANTKISVLNGIRPEDMKTATSSRAKPVLNTIEQIKRWSVTNRPCDIMINTGMNRLGIDAVDLAGADVGALSIDMAMSHLASADEDRQQNTDQLNEYTSSIAGVVAKRFSLANSAGIALGPKYQFDCTRPGLSLYGGIPRNELSRIIRQVVFPQAQILQVREIQAGDKLGYNAKFIAPRDMPIAILAMGYADGYLRSFSNAGLFKHEEADLPVIGRVSMDLIAIDLSSAPQLEEGDWVDCDYDLLRASKQSGLSQYELLTGLGNRCERFWI